FFTTTGSWMSRSTSRRACSRSSSRLASVMSRSAYGRSSFALIRVVRIRSCSKSAEARLRSMAIRWGVIRPSFRCATRCLMDWSWLLPRRRGRPVVELHAQAQPHPGQDLLDLVERLPAEVLGLEHVRLGLLHELADGADVRVLEAVVGADGELHLVDALVELVHPRFALGVRAFADLALGLLVVFLEVDEDREVVLHELGREAHGVAGRDRAVGPDLEGELLVVGSLAHARRVHEVVDLLDRRVDGVEGDPP